MGSEDLRQHIADVPDFPRKGILFRDITPLLASPGALSAALDELERQAREFRPDLVAGIESRGFLFGMPLADRIGTGFIPVRKPGKLPRETLRESYSLEYGENTVEMHADAVRPGQRVLVVDDLLATGGTAAAAASLVRRAGGEVAGWLFLVELAPLRGREKLAGAPVRSVLVY